METPTEPAATSLAVDRKIQSPNKITFIGYLLLGISAGLYALGEYVDVSRDDNFSVFFIHYFISLAYVIILISNESYGIRLSWRKKNIHKTIVLLNLFLVSAYALNRQLPVFENSVTWFCVYLLITSAVMMSYRYIEQLPKAVNHIQYLLLGSAVVLYLYLSIHVANFYAFGTLGIIAIGIGAHIFVPVLLLIAAIHLLITNHEKNRAGVWWTVSGAIITIGIVIVFMVVWNTRAKAIERVANQSVIHADTDLPVWVKASQTFKNDWITERILKSELVYTVSNNHFQWDFLPNNSWDEQRKHDPLVFLASTTTTSSLSDNDRMTILKAITDNRSRGEERLWAGDNLVTSYIVTDVDIYPELRLAYTEHYLNIRNNAIKGRWRGNSQEAIYTFQLPEGSVVTSLSLWVNGKEEKAILTSKQKAKEAYTTIVGREMRDPSVVHWQEGNTISVRVFPCTPDEERKFKLGITSPLPVVGDQIVYENVTFRGPRATEATQTSRVRIIGNSEHLELPGNFTKNVKGEYLSEGTYDPDLTITMDAVPLKTNQFSFDGFSYSFTNPDPATSTVAFTDIYLDLNNSWTPEEIDALYPLLQEYRFHACVDNVFVPISSENWEAVTDELQQNNFSLFPFHHIKNTETALVITKGKALSPHLQDFKTSAFADGIRNYFACGKKVYVFNLEGGTSTYIKSLKEFRAFRFAHGRTDVLLSMLRNKQFPLTTESDEQVVLHESDMIIKKKQKTEQDDHDNAPDHLARIFAYNNIMRQVGVNFFNDDFVNEKLVDEAATAYVVSPVSSLIVLETQEDYERFGIKDKENSLHNATKNSSGAVPEPHEWALIIIFLAFIAFQVLRNPRFKFSLVRK